jgi:hypothetical protein
MSQTTKKKLLDSISKKACAATFLRLSDKNQGADHYERELEGCAAKADKSGWSSEALQAEESGREIGKSLFDEIGDGREPDFSGAAEEDEEDEEDEE